MAFMKYVLDIASQDETKGCAGCFCLTERACLEEQQADGRVMEGQDRTEDKESTASFTSHSEILHQGISSTDTCRGSPRVRPLSSVRPNKNATEPRQIVIWSFWHDVADGTLGLFQNWATRTEKEP